MDKAQALYSFWSQFGIPAYEAGTVPVNAAMPYITYSVQTGDLDVLLTINANLWYRSKSWAGIMEKVDEIAQTVGENGYWIGAVDNGYLRVMPHASTPFAQTMTEDDNMIRRVYLTLNAEFLTTY